MIRKTVFQYLFFVLLSRFAISFIAATYVVFLLSHGMDVFQVGLVNGTFYVTLLICEIPTGVFADIFGRKISYALSYFFLSASMLFYAVSDSFWEFVLAEMICAVGGTFGNGAFDAWLKDKLDFHGCEKSRLRSVFAKRWQVSQAACAVGAVLGAWLGAVDLALPWIVGGVVSFVGGILVLLVLKEEYFEKKTFSFKESVAFTGRALRTGTSNKVIRFVVVMTFAQVFVLQAPNMQWQPFFLALGFSKPQLGYVSFMISASIIAGALISSWLLGRLKNDEKKFLALSQIFMAAGIVFSGASDVFLLSVSAFLFHEFARGLFAPIKDDFVNQSILEGTRERATLLSIESMSHHLGGAMGLVASGFVARCFSIQTTWLVFGGFLAIATLFIFKNGKK